MSNATNMLTSNGSRIFDSELIIYVFCAITMTLEIKLCCYIHK